MINGQVQRQQQPDQEIGQEEADELGENEEVEEGNVDGNVGKRT